MRADVDQVDALRFEQLVRAATADHCSPQESRSLCHEALQLWRGVPFGELADVDPFRLEAMRLDELRMLAMETLNRNGRRREALDACGELRSLLAEIGLEPGPSLIALEDRIVQGTDA